MTTIEAKEKISQELMDAFREWIQDWDEMPNDELGQKYGYGKGTSRPKWTFDGLKHYMDLVFGGRYMPGWIKAGYPKEVIWDLGRDGFLSYKCYTNWQARHTGRTEWYYIPQRTAREIWKANKNA